MLERLLPDSAHRRRSGVAATLGVVGFGQAPDPGDCAGAPAVHVPLDLLLPHAPVFDVCPAGAAVHIECSDGITTASDGRLLFGHVAVDEPAPGGLQAAARQAYAAIFALLGRHDCAFPLRFWNYVPHINRTLDGLERYRHFNVGRQEAFLAAGRAAFAGAPAACAIGTQHAPLRVVFLAARDAPLPIENPRQVSAYDYPAQYGPRSPTFSRASLALAGKPVLFISGTASIVGHRSLHAGDAAAQTRETFVNLAAVVDAANTKLPQPALALDRLAYTVYVRRPADLAVVRAQFLLAVGAQSDAARRAVFLQGDICRGELLVEIEALGSAA